MLQRALIKSDQTAFLQKKLHIWLDNAYCCTRNTSSKINMDCL